MADLGLGEKGNPFSIRADLFWWDIGTVLGLTFEGKPGRRVPLERLRRLFSRLPRVDPPAFRGVACFGRWTKLSS